MADLKNQYPGDPEALLREAIDALQAAEALLAMLDRSGILRKLDELRSAVESFPQVQLDMRMARIRLIASLSHDPDKTPVNHIKGASSANFKAVKPNSEKP